MRKLIHADTAFAYGVSDICQVYWGGGGDPDHARVRRIYRKLCNRSISPTSGRAYLPGEWDSLQQEGRLWAGMILERLNG